MRIDVSADFATLKVGKRSGGSRIELRFDPATIQNWYPYNNGYTYRINPDGEIQLFKETGVHAVPHEITGLHYLNTNLWFNKHIWEDNKRVADFAGAMGVHSPFTTYTNLDVSRGMTIVGKTIDSMAKKYTLDYAKTSGHRFNQGLESLALRELPEQDQKLFARVGEVYTMLNTMRKVVTVNGFGRPAEPPVWGADTYWS